MKKSIFKVTAWSIVISVAIIITVEKRFNNFDSKKLIGLNQEFEKTDETEQENNSEVNEPQGNGIDYNATVSKVANEDQNLGFESKNAATNDKSTSIASPIMGADLAYENTQSKVESANTNEPTSSQEAIAKGGPSNNSFQNQESVTASSSITSPTSSASTISAPTTSARITAPTIVTTPPNPTGGSSGGSGAGDPYVPIDDYYGLIFLIAISTIVGIFTIKKTKLV